MGKYAGFDLPLSFSKFNVKDVVEKTRKPNFTTVFDVSHMGVYETRIQDSVTEKLSDLFKTDLKNLQNNKAKLTVILNEMGNVLDDLIISNVENKKYRLVVNASNNTTNFFDSFSESLKKKDKSIIALQGDGSQKLLENIINDSLTSLYFMENKVLVKNKFEICRCGYTGEDGFEISVPNVIVENLIKLLTDKDAKPIGLGARDTLRLEAGLCLYGHELNQEINPIQANLKWAIWKKRRETGGFKGWENIKKDLQNGVSKIRVGVKPAGKIIAREGTKIYSNTGEEIGIITSGTYGPSVNSPVAMGYVKSKFSEIDNKILIEVRGKKHEAKVSKLPFYKKSYVK